MRMIDWGCCRSRRPPRPTLKVSFGTVGAVRGARYEYAGTFVVRRNLIIVHTYGESALDVGLRALALCSVVAVVRSTVNPNLA